MLRERDLGRSLEGSEITLNENSGSVALDSRRTETLCEEL